MPRVVRIMNAIRKRNGFTFYFGVGNLTQKMMNTIETGFFLIDRLDYPPREPERNIEAGSVNGQAMAKLRTVPHCKPDLLATMVPATPDDRT